MYRAIELGTRIAVIWCLVALAIGFVWILAATVYESKHNPVVYDKEPEE